MVCQGTHILERYRWKILKLCQINGLILGLTPVVFPHLANFVNPRNSSAALCCFVPSFICLMASQPTRGRTRTDERGTRSNGCRLQRGGGARVSSVFRVTHATRCAESEWQRRSAAATGWMFVNIDSPFNSARKQICSTFSLCDG